MKRHIPVLLLLLLGGILMVLGGCASTRDFPAGTDNGTVYSIWDDLILLGRWMFFVGAGSAVLGLGVRVGAIFYPFLAPFVWLSSLIACIGGVCFVLGCGVYWAGTHPLTVTVTLLASLAAAVAWGYAHWKYVHAWFDRRSSVVAGAVKARITDDLIGK